MWKRATVALSGSPYSVPMTEAVGEIYVRKHFSPQAKAEIRNGVKSFKAKARKPR